LGKKKNVSGVLLSTNKFIISAFQFRMILLQVLAADFGLAWVVDRSCLWLFGEGKLRIP
jgi:hypothetical protein